MFKLHPKASSSPSPRRPSFGQAGLRQAPRNCVFFSNKTWWFWSYQTLGLGMLFFFCMNTGVFVLVREENRDWWWMVRNCRLESGPHLRYLRGYTVIYSSYKPLMWVKQSQTTHLGMVYSTYLWWWLGDGLWHHFTHIKLITNPKFTSSKFNHEWECSCKYKSQKPRQI